MPWQRLHVIAGFVGSFDDFNGHGQGSVAAWVVAVYNEVLGRQPSSAEIAFWIAALG